MRFSRPAPVHPLLLAAFPLIFLFAQNVEQTPTPHLLVPLAVTLAATAAGLAVATVLLGDARRAALPVSAAVLAFFSYGHVRAAVDGGPLAGPDGRAAVLLGIWLALTAAVIWLAARARRNVREMTSILNVVGGALVLVSLVPAALHVVTVRTSADPATHDLPTGATGDATPDIYYFIFDRYGSEETFERVFGIDNGPFLRWLEEQGFQITPRSRANYPKTAHSLASALNMTYLDPLVERYGQDYPDWLPVYGLLQDHAVGRFLQRQGYTYVHIGSWWEPTTTNSIADHNPRFDERSDFGTVLYDTTLAAAVADWVAGEPDDPWRRRHFDIVDFQLQELRRARERPGPRFVLAHILLPHEPYVFDADGRYVTAEQERTQSREEAFAAQLGHTNTLIKQLVTDLLADAGDGQGPVIILSADEGPHPEAYERGDQDAWNWEQASVDDLEEKLQILNAIWLPDGQDPGLYDDLSPVNLFPMLFNHYFDAGLPLLEDRQHVFQDNARPLLFTDVTDRLKAGRD